MKAILMAAGKGNRISRMIQDVPKSTLPINGEPLIRYTVKKLLEFHLEPVVVVGYKKEYIYEALKGLPVTYYVNPFFNDTNSIASLWFAREELQGDTIIMNADVFLSDPILTDILNDEHPTVMSIDVTRCKTGDYFFSTVNGVIKKYGKNLPLHERTCEYVGIAKVSASFQDTFRQRLDKMIDDGEYHVWWENVLYSFVDTEEHEIHTIDVKELFWSEIDYFDDYERILNYLEQQKHIAVN